MDRAADGYPYRYHATGLPAGGDAPFDYRGDELSVEMGLLMLRGTATISFVAHALVGAGIFIATGSVIALAIALLAGNLAARMLD